MPLSHSNPSRSPRNDVRPIHDFTCERPRRHQVKLKTPFEGSVLREVAATTMKRSTIPSGYAEANSCHYHKPFLEQFPLSNRLLRRDESVHNLSFCAPRNDLHPSTTARGLDGTAYTVNWGGPWLT